MLSTSSSSQMIETKCFLDHPLRAGSPRKRQNQASSQTAPTGLAIRHFSPQSLIMCPSMSNHPLKVNKNCLEENSTLEKVVKGKCSALYLMGGLQKGKKGSQSGVTRDPSHCALHTPTFSFSSFDIFSFLIWPSSSMFFRHMLIS